MISFEQAQQAVLSRCKILTAETVALSDVLHRVLAEDIYSPENLPPFNNTAMDGFALMCNGSPMAAGTECDVTGWQAAGDGIVRCKSGACEIMTGALMPPGFDSIVPIEQVTVLARDDSSRPTRVRLQAEVSPGQHVRLQGQDVAAGQLLLGKGNRIGIAARMLLAAVGISRMAVMPQARIAVLTTGRELISDPEQALQPGQIRNSNGPYLADRLHAMGAQLCLQESVPDDVEHFQLALQRSMDVGAQIVISTGAVSMGRYDFVPDTLAHIGAEIIFHKVAMRPGKPLLFAVLPNGALYFGLPGNPISSAVGLRFFVEPALRAMQGMPMEQSLTAPLMHAADKKTDFRLLQKARVALDAQGQLHVELLAGQESFRIKPLLAANAWAVLPETTEHFPIGSYIELFGLDANGITLSTDGIS